MLNTRREVITTDNLHKPYQGRPVAEDFDTALKNWLERASKIASSYTLTIDPNSRKYIRVVMCLKIDPHQQRSVFCFIEKATGNVLKAGTWKAPAKHARGNIYEIGKEGVGEYGAHYLK